MLPNDLKDLIFKACEVHDLRADYACGIVEFHLSQPRTCPTWLKQKLKDGAIFTFDGHDVENWTTSTRVGLSLERAREVLVHYDMFAYPSAWERAIVHFCASVEMQVDYFVQKLARLASGLKPADNLMIAYWADRRGVWSEDRKIISGCPEAREAAILSIQYRTKADAEDEGDE